MVTIFKKQDNARIEQAIHTAEKGTRAEIVFVVTPISDPYFAATLIQGLLVSFIVALILWLGHIPLAVPAMLALQAVIMLLYSLLPPRLVFCRALVGGKMVTTRTTQRAHTQYHAVQRQLPATAPFVVMMVSLAEHQARVLASPLVSAQIPDSHWDAVIATFTRAITSEGLTEASVQAIGQIGAIMARDFPENGEDHHFSNTVIETR